MCIIEKPYNRSYDGGYSNQLRYLDKMIDLKITELVGAGEMEKPINRELQSQLPLAYIGSGKMEYRRIQEGKWGTICLGCRWWWRRNKSKSGRGMTSGLLPVPSPNEL